MWPGGRVPSGRRAGLFRADPFQGGPAVGGRVGGQLLGGPVEVGHPWGCPAVDRQAAAPIAMAQASTGR